jgi:hypothetical protein
MTLEEDTSASSAAPSVGGAVDDANDADDPDVEEESVDSQLSNISFLGDTVDPALVHHVEVLVDFCRAIHGVGDASDVPCICCRGPRCRSLGHANSRKAGRRAPPGLYLALVSSEGQVLGGVPGARLTEADLLEARRLAQVRDEELVRAALALQNESVTFEDTVYETPKEFNSLPLAQAQVLDRSPGQETSKPAALPSGAVAAPDSASGSETAVLMAVMTEQMRQMSANNKALTDLLAAQTFTNPVASTLGGIGGDPQGSGGEPRKFYAVARGRTPGIYETRKEALEQVEYIPNAVWRSFKTYSGAQSFLSAYTEGAASRDLGATPVVSPAPQRPASILRKASTHTPLSKSDRKTNEWSVTCPNCQGDHLEEECPIRTELHETAQGQPKTYYAVARGRKPGVYSTWGDCHKQVSGVEGHLYKPFKSFEAAFNFYVDNVKPVAPATPSAEPLVPGPTGTHDTDSGGEQRASTNRIQGRATGRDPSTGKDTELFSTTVRSESLLVDLFTPENISPVARQSLTDATVDAVAQPGAYRTTDVDDQTNTLTLSVATLASRSGGAQRVGNASDFLWRSDKRTTIKYGLTTLELLKQRIDDLEEVGDRVMEHLTMVTRDILVQEGWTEAAALDWATSSLIFRISNDSIRNYIGLHQRLYSVGLSEGWAMAKAELDHHASKLATRRQTAPSRLVAMCENYIYLRDAKKSSWRTLQLMEAREKALEKRVDDISKGGGVGVTGGTGVAACKKCHTLLHPGGQAQCPFKNMSNTKAAEAVTSLMSALLKLSSEDK